MGNEFIKARPKGCPLDVMLLTGALADCCMVLATAAAPGAVVAPAWLLPTCACATLAMPLAMVPLVRTAEADRKQYETVAPAVEEGHAQRAPKSLYVAPADGMGQGLFAARARAGVAEAERRCCPMGCSVTKRPREHTSLCASAPPRPSTAVRPTCDARHRSPAESIPKATYLFDYSGELLTHSEYLARYPDSVSDYTAALRHPCAQATARRRACCRARHRSRLACRTPRMWHASLARPSLAC